MCTDYAGLEIPIPFRTDDVSIFLPKLPMH